MWLNPQIWSHLRKKSWKENFIFCAVYLASGIYDIQLFYASFFEHFHNLRIY